jgi:signal transduction histidine kinase
MSMKQEGGFTKEGTIFKTQVTQHRKISQLIFESFMGDKDEDSERHNYVTLEWKNFVFRDEKCFLLTMIDMTAIVLLREE